MLIVYKGFIYETTKHTKDYYLADYITDKITKFVLRAYNMFYDHKLANDERDSNVPLAELLKDNKWSEKYYQYVKSNPLTKYEFNTPQYGHSLKIPFREIFGSDVNKAISEYVKNDYDIIENANDEYNHYVQTGKISDNTNVDYLIKFIAKKYDIDSSNFDELQKGNLLKKYITQYDTSSFIKLIQKSSLILTEGTPSAFNDCLTFLKTKTACTGAAVNGYALLLPFFKTNEEDRSKAPDQLLRIERSLSTYRSTLLHEISHLVDRVNKLPMKATHGLPVDEYFADQSEINSHTNEILSAVEKYFISRLAELKKQKGKIKVDTIGKISEDTFEYNMYVQAMNTFIDLFNNRSKFIEFIIDYSTRILDPHLIDFIKYVRVDYELNSKFIDKLDNFYKDFYARYKNVFPNKKLKALEPNWPGKDEEESN